MTVTGNARQLRCGKKELFFPDQSFILQCKVKTKSVVQFVRACVLKTLRLSPSSSTTLGIKLRPELNLKINGTVQRSKHNRHHVDFNYFVVIALDKN